MSDHTDTTSTAEEEPNVELEIECPGCGLHVVGDSPRSSADWFCPRCDYPLFWVEERHQDLADRPVSHAARRRLPGSGSRRVLGAEPCWHCGEMTEPGDVECRRCAASIPKPTAPVVEVERVVEVVVPVPTPVTLPWWPFAVAAALGAAAVGSAVGLLLGGG